MRHRTSSFKRIMADAQEGSGGTGSPLILDIHTPFPSMILKNLFNFPILEFITFIGLRK